MFLIQNKQNAALFIPTQDNDPYIGGRKCVPRFCGDPDESANAASQPKKVE